jgi:hypothetical protein
MTEADILTFLRAVESGTVTLTLVPERSVSFCGEMEFTASNGWRVRIMNRCNSWRYLDEAEDAAGDVADFDMLDGMPLVCGYQPSADVQRRCYQIPVPTAADIARETADVLVDVGKATLAEIRRRITKGTL